MKRPHLLALALALAVGAFFRLYLLGDASLRADSLEFWRICSMPTGAAGIWDHWLQVMGLSGQFPFAMSATKAFLDAFHLEPSFLNLRLPSAIWGILSVLAAYRAGEAIRGPWFGALLAALTALNPFHVQMTREAYYYPPLVLGAFCSLSAAVRSVQAWVARAAPRRVLPLAAEAVAGFFLMTYSQPTGWLVALALGGFTLLAWLDLYRRRAPRAGVASLALLAGFVVVGLPLLFAPWGLHQLQQISTGAIKEHSMKALEANPETFATMMFKASTSFAWGATPLRAALTYGLLLSGLAALVRGARKAPHAFVLPGAIAVAVVGFLYTRASAGAMYETRYLICVLPAYVGILALGLAELGALLASRIPKAAAAIPVAALALLLPPAWYCTQLTGQPTPYGDIVRWCDSHLPQGTPVLVDRWFEPGNELVPHPSTNVVFTFTVPNEPPDTFRQVRWRDTAMSFFQRFPDAAYLEIAKTYWELPDVGPWAEPRAFFARHAGITNEAALKLRRLGVASRSDFYWGNTNRVVVDVFYNTREDVMAARKKAGLTAFVYFGTGWGYTKTQDYRDWHVLQDRAVLELINLGDAPVDAKLVVRGAAIGEPLELIGSAGGQHTFPPNQLSDWTSAPITLQPGVNPVELRVARGGSARKPFLLESATVAR